MGFKTGWVKVMDAFGQYSTVKLDQLGDLLEIGEVENLRSFIDAHSNAKVVAYGISDVTLIDATGFFSDDTDKGSYDAINQRLVFHFKDADTGRRLSFSIPAPINGDVDTDQQPKASVAKDVRAKIAELTSREEADLHYLGGGLRSKVPPIDRRRKKIDSTT